MQGRHFCMLFNSIILFLGICICLNYHIYLWSDYLGNEWQELDTCEVIKSEYYHRCDEFGCNEEYVQLKIQSGNITGWACSSPYADHSLLTRGKKKRHLHTFTECAHESWVPSCTRAQVFLPLWLCSLCEDCRTFTHEPTDCLYMTHNGAADNAALLPNSDDEFNIMILNKEHQHFPLHDFIITFCIPLLMLIIIPTLFCISFLLYECKLHAAGVGFVKLRTPDASNISTQSIQKFKMDRLNLKLDLSRLNLSDPSTSILDSEFPVHSSSKDTTSSLEFSLQSKDPAIVTMEGLTDSVNSFLKQSGDIKEEIKRLSEIGRQQCKEELKRQNEIGRQQSNQRAKSAINLTIPSKNEMDFPAYTLEQVNSMLSRVGFPKITNLDYAIDSLIQVLYRFELLVQQGQSEKARWQNLESQIESYKNKIKKQKQNISTNESSTSGVHIALYQKENDQLRSEIARLKQATEYLNQVCAIFDVKNLESLVPCVKKVDTVLRWVPKMEKFIKHINELILPSVEQRTGIEQVIPKLQKDYSDLNKLRQFKKQIQETFGTCKINELIHAKMQQAQIDQSGLQRFRSYFQQKENQDIRNLVDEVYLFVREVTGYIIIMRQLLNLDDKYTQTQVLEKVREVLKSYSS